MTKSRSSNKVTAIRATPLIFKAAPVMEGLPNIFFHWCWDCCCRSMKK
jgi:hypothetical protein